MLLRPDEIASRARFDPRAVGASGLIEDLYAPEDIGSYPGMERNTKR